MSRYIDADALYRYFTFDSSGRKYPLHDCDNFPCTINLADVQKVIRNAPTADVAPVVRGEWIGYHGDKLVGMDDSGADVYRYWRSYRCPECRKGTAVKSPFCPSCGADMREAEK